MKKLIALGIILILASVCSGQDAVPTSADGDSVASGRTGIQDILDRDDSDESEYPLYAILTRVDEVTSFSYNENDTCSSWQASLSNNPIELQANIVGLNFEIADNLGLPYDSIYEEAYAFINYYGYIVPKWSDPYEEYYYQYNTYDWTFINTATFECYWSPFGDQELDSVMLEYPPIDPETNLPFWTSYEEVLVVLTSEYASQRRVPYNKKYQFFYWTPEYPLMDEYYRYKDWDEDLTKPPTYQWSSEYTYWQPEEAGDIVLIHPDLYEFIESGEIPYTQTKLSTKYYVFLDHFTQEPLLDLWTPVEVDVSNPPAGTWKLALQVDIKLFSEYVQVLDIPYDIVNKKFFYSAEEYPSLCDGSYKNWTAANPPYYPDNQPYWTPGDKNIKFVAYWTIWYGKSFKYSEYQRWYVGSSGDEAEEEFLVSDYFFISYETGEPFWNPFKPPFQDKQVKLSASPTDPITGEPFWSNDWDVYTMTVEEYLNDNRLAYWVENNEFIWGPGEYPANGEGSFSFWDENKIPVHFDGETKYYDPKTQTILFLTSYEFYQLEEGETVANQTEFSNADFVFLCLNEDYVTPADSLLKPKPLNNPFDTTVTSIDLEQLAQQKGYETWEINVTSIDTYFQYIFYLPYDDVAQEFIWGPGEYPHKENASYVLWTTANPPKSPDGVAYWGSTQTIIWKEQSEYVPPAETDQDEADFGSFAEKDIVDATEYAFLNATTFEPLWDIFDPPKRVIKSTDEIINPETRQPYWQNASEVFLVPISTAVQYLPLPYNVETSTFYWGPGEYPQNYDGSYQNWTISNAPCDLQGNPLWDENDIIIWVPFEEYDSEDSTIEQQTIFSVDEYAFLNASDTEPYFDVFSPPAGLKLVEITRAPLKSDGNPYWENEWDVWVVSIEDYLAFHRIAFNSATQELIWEPYDYPQNPDGSFTKWTSLNPPYHPDGRPFWIPGSEIDFLTYDQYWLVSEGIEFDPDGPLKTKYFAFLNTETGQPYWDPFNPPEETVNLVDSLVNSVSGDKYWTELSSVEIQPLFYWIQQNMRVPFDENTDRYLWTPDSYPQNSDKTYTEWTDVAIPYCSDGTNKYWTSANFKNLQWITPQQFQSEEDKQEDNYWVSDYVFINTITNLPYFDPFNVPLNIQQQINLYDAPLDANGDRYWYDISEVEVIEIYYFVQQMPIPYNKITKSAYWGPGETPRDSQYKYRSWWSIAEIPLQWDDTPYWTSGDITNIVWLTPDEYYDVVNGICEPGQTKFPVSKYVFYLAGTNTLYYEVFSLADNVIIDINDFAANPWNSRKEVRIGLLSQYLNYEYPIPYDKASKEYFWLPGQYPVNHDGTYSKWTSQTPPKSPDNKNLWVPDYDQLIWVDIQEYYSLEYLGLKPDNKIIQSNEIVLFNWQKQLPCVNPFAAVVSVDLSDPSDIPQLNGSPCWEYFYEISVMTFEQYVSTYLKLPYHKDKKQFLWTPQTIPIASDGKIKDWEHETNGPQYADSTSASKKYYYTSADATKLVWVDMYDYYGYQPELPTTLNQNEWVAYNWAEETVLSNPFGSGTFTLAQFASVDPSNITLIPSEEYIKYYTKIPVLITTVDSQKVRTPLWKPGQYPKSSTGYQEWTLANPPKYLDGTEYWPANTVVANLDFITQGEFYREFSEYQFPYETHWEEHPSDQKYSNLKWVFLKPDQSPVYSLPVTPEVIVDCNLNTPPLPGSLSCSDVQIISLDLYLNYYLPRPYSSANAEPFFGYNYPLKYDGTVKIWDANNSPVYADGVKFWAAPANVIMVEPGDYVLHAEDFVFVKVLDRTLWWNPGQAPAQVIQISNPPANKWTNPSEVEVIDINDYYTNHTLPYLKSSQKLAWIAGQYPVNSDGSYSEYSSVNPPMAADGSLFWTSGAEILWVPPDNEVEEPNPTFSTTEYAIIDYVTDLPYVGLFSNPPITGTFAQGPLVDSANTAKGYLWIANDVYFVPLGDYLSKNYIPVNAQGEPYFEEYPCNKDGTFSQWSNTRIPVAADGVPYWNSNPFWLTRNEFQELLNNTETIFKTSDYVFLHKNNLALPFWTTDPADDYIYINYPPQKADSTPYWQSASEVSVVPRATYNRWNRKYDINEYVFLKVSDGTPYWPFDTKPTVTGGIVDLALPAPNNPSGSPFWASAAEVQVISKLQWFVLSKTYPTADFEFYNRDDYSTFTVTGTSVNLDAPGVGLWTNRNKVKVYPKSPNSRRRFLADATDAQAASGSDSEEEGNFYDDAGVEVPDFDDLPSYEYDSSYGLMAFEQLDLSLFTYRWSLKAAIAQDAADDYLFPCDIEQQIYQALYDNFDGVKPEMGWGCQIAKEWVYWVNWYRDVDLSDDETWDELVAYAKADPEYQPYEFESLQPTATRLRNLRLLQETQPAFNASTYNYTNTTANTTYLNEMLVDYYNQLGELEKNYNASQAILDNPESTAAQKQDAQDDMDEILEDAKEIAEQIQVIVDHLYEQDESGSFEGNSDYQDEEDYTFDWADVSWSYSEYEQDIAYLYESGQLSKLQTPQQLTDLRESLFKTGLVYNTDHLFIPPEQIQKGLTYYFEMTVLYKGVEVIQNPSITRVDIYSSPPQFKQISETDMDDFLKVQKENDAGTLVDVTDGLTSFGFYTLKVDVVSYIASLRLPNLTGLKINLYFWIYPYDWQEYEIDPSTKQGEFLKILDQQYGGSIATIVLRIYHDEKVWWGVKFLKVTGGECETLTDDVDLFEAYDLYDDSVDLTDELLDALFASLDPTQGLQSKQNSATAAAAPTSTDSEATEGPISDLSLCGPNDKCYEHGTCQTEQGRKYCKCDLDHNGNKCEYTQEEWTKKQTAANKIVNTVITSDSTDEKKVAQRVANSAQLPGTDQGVRDQLEEKLTGQVKASTSLDNVPTYLQSASTISQSALEDSKTPLSDSQSSARETASSIATSASKHVSEDNPPFQSNLKNMEIKISPVESASRRRRRILADGDQVTEFTSAVIPGVTTRAKVSVATLSPILTKSSSVLITSYRSSYISSIPKIELLSAPLIEIQFLSNQGAPQSLQSGETYQVSFGWYSNIALQSNVKFVGVKLSESNTLVDDDGITFVSQDKISVTFKLSKTGIFSFKQVVIPPKPDDPTTPSGDNKKQMQENGLINSILILLLAMVTFI